MSRLLLVSLLMMMMLATDVSCRRRRSSRNRVRVLPQREVQCPTGPPLRVAAFNIQNLSPLKFAKPEVQEILVAIALRYDVLFIEEVADVTSVVMPQFTVAVNQAAPPAVGYNFVLSSRVGRRSGEVEQYAVLYRTDRVQITSAEDYPDPEDKFSRDPFIVGISRLDLDSRPFYGVVLHAVPDSTSTKATVAEISALTDVYDYIAQTYKSEDVLFVGDFNGDCRYVVQRDWAQVTLATRPEYLWLINNDEDTTVADGTACAYDRLVAAGTSLQQSVIANSNSTYRFDGDDSPIGVPISKETALTVSDHYPVQLLMCW